jgi:hypothetical protein
LRFVYKLCNQNRRSKDPNCKNQKSIRICEDQKGTRSIQICKDPKIKKSSSMDLHDHMLKTCSWSTVEHIYVQSSQIGETNIRCRFQGVSSSLWSRAAHLTMHFASTSLAIFTNLCSCSHNLIICQKEKRKMAEHPTTTYPGSSQISAHFEEEGPY